MTFLSLRRRVYHSWRLWTIAVVRSGVIRCFRLFPPSLFIAHKTVVTEIFFPFANSVIFRVVSFRKAFWTFFRWISCGLPDRGRPLKLTMFFRRFATCFTVDKLTFCNLTMSVFLCPAWNWADISFISASICKLK